MVLRVIFFNSSTAIEHFDITNNFSSVSLFVNSEKYKYIYCNQPGFVTDGCNNIAMAMSNGSIVLDMLFEKMFFINNTIFELYYVRNNLIQWFYLWKSQHMFRLYPCWFCNQWIKAGNIDYFVIGIGISSVEQRFWALWNDKQWPNFCEFLLKSHQTLGLYQGWIGTCLWWAR